MTRASSARLQLVASMSEDDLKANVIDAAVKLGWRVAHFRPARTEKGWRTPVEGHAGFVDLVMARRGSVILAELKSERGRVEPEQIEWRMAIVGPVEDAGAVVYERRSFDDETGSLTYATWYPHDWPEAILTCLR